MITAYVPSAIHAPAATPAIHICPAGESIRIEGLIAPTPITVISIGGQTVWQETVTDGERISIAHLPKGVYLVRVNGKTIKIIK
jgi:hypothetical protein